tara:strand:+ start:35394 stop:36164 length:771 start_codon:yes stop_codon:yes gene_type:complete
MPINIAIIEDEPAIARNLEFIISELDNSITVLKKLASVKESVDWLEKNSQKCDLLLMDIRLEDGLSFEIFNSIPPTVPVIFITAFDNYAIDAFKVNGIDYILKPFEESDIEKALTKFQLSRNTNVNQNKIEMLLEHFEKSDKKSFKEAYLVHFQNKLIPISVASIQWFYTEQEVVYAMTNEGKKYVIDTILDKICEEIPSKQFFRANRQYIVQKTAILDVDFYFNGRLIVNVSPKPLEKIIISKAKASEFKKWLDE